MKLLTVYNTSPLLVSIRELKWTQSHIVTRLKEAVKPLIPKKAGCLFISAWAVNAVLSFAEHLHRTTIT